MPLGWFYYQNAQILSFLLTLLSVKTPCKYAGNSFGTSLSVNFWNHRMAIHHQDMVAAVNTGNPNFISYLHNTAGTFQDKLVVINNIITEQAAIMGVNDIIIGSGVLILLLIPLVMLARKTNK